MTYSFLTAATIPQIIEKNAYRLRIEIDMWTMKFKKKIKNNQIILEYHIILHQKSIP